MKPYFKWLVPVIALIVVVLFVVGRSQVEEEQVEFVTEAPVPPTVTPEVAVEEEEVPATIVQAPDPEPLVDDTAWAAQADAVDEMMDDEWVEEEIAAEPDPDLPTRPEFMASTGAELQASPKDETVRDQAMLIQRRSGPEALDEARQLLTSGDSELGLIAAAILMNEPEWDADLLDAVLGHESLGVPLYAWQGLRDAGRHNDAAALEDGVLRRMSDVSNWSDWIAGAGLPGTAVRGLIDFAAIQLDGNQFAEVLDTLVLDDNGDYAGRMRALLAHEDTLEFEAYRDRVYQELERSLEGQNRVWSAGLERLVERLEGPVAVHTDVRIVVPEDVDLMMAREYPAMFEDLALLLERSLERGDALFAHGLNDRIELLLEESQRRPLSAGDRNALERIESLRGQFEEQDLAGLPSPVPPFQEQ